MQTLFTVALVWAAALAAPGTAQIAPDSVRSPIDGRLEHRDPVGGLEPYDALVPFPGSAIRRRPVGGVDSWLSAADAASVDPGILLSPDASHGAVIRSIVPPLDVDRCIFAPLPPSRRRPRDPE